MKKTCLVFFLFSTLCFSFVVSTYTFFSRNTSVDQSCTDGCHWSQTAKSFFARCEPNKNKKNIQNNKLETYDCTYIVFVIAVFCVANGVAIALVIIFAASQTDYEHMYMMIDCYQPYEVHNHLTPPHRKKKYYMNKRYWRGQ